MISYDDYERVCDSLELDYGIPPYDMPTDKIIRLNWCGSAIGTSRRLSARYGCTWGQEVGA